MAHHFHKEYLEKTETINKAVERFDDLKPGYGSWVQDMTGFYIQVCAKTPQVTKEYQWCRLRRPILLESTPGLKRCNKAWIQYNRDALHRVPAVTLARAMWYYHTITVPVMQWERMYDSEIECMKAAYHHLYEVVRSWHRSKVMSGIMQDEFLKDFPPEGSTKKVYRRYRIYLIKFYANMVYHLNRNLVLRHLEERATENGILLEQTIPIPGMPNCPPDTVRVSNIGWMVPVKRDWKPEPRKPTDWRWNFRSDNYLAGFNSSDEPTTWKKEWNYKLDRLDNDAIWGISQSYLGLHSKFCVENSEELIRL